MTTTTIQKWGNSYGVRLPIRAVHKLRLRAGNTVAIHESKHGGTLSIVPVKSRTRTLAEMVALITEGNRHDATDWGSPIGKEVW